MNTNSHHDGRDHEMTRITRIQQIDPSDLTASDLREEAETAGDLAGAYRVTIDGEAESVQALVVPFASDASTGRIGIAWGADATWGDVSHIWAPDDGVGVNGHICDGFHGITDAIDDCLDDADAWEARA